MVEVKRKGIVVVLSFLVLAVVGAMLVCLPRPVFRAKSGCVRLICEGVADMQVPYHDGMTLHEAIAASPAFAKFGTEKAEDVWFVACPMHSTLSDGGEAIKQFLITRKPDWWRAIANDWPDVLGAPPARRVRLDEPLKSGDALQLTMIW